MCRAGELHRKVFIQRVDTSRPLDSSGRIDRTASITWVPFDGRDGRRWAKKRTLGGREFARAKESYSETTDVFDVRWDDETKGITSQERVCHEGVIYQVIVAYEVTDDGMRHELVRLVCKRKD